LPPWRGNAPAPRRTGLRAGGSRSTGRCRASKRGTWRNTPVSLAAALAYAPRYQGRMRVHNADEIMAEIVAKRLIEHLERAGFGR